MSDPLPDRTAETAAWLRREIDTARSAGTVAGRCDAVTKFLDLYDAAAAQARRDNRSLYTWSPNFDFRA